MSRLPVEPLCTLLDTSPRLLARQLGRSGTQAHKALERGLSLDQADRWAVASGYHPATVWGDAWWDAALAAPVPDDDARTIRARNRARFRRLRDQLARSGPQDEPGGLFCGRRWWEPATREW